MCVERGGGGGKNVSTTLIDDGKVKPRDILLGSIVVVYIHEPIDRGRRSKIKITIHACINKVYHTGPEIDHELHSYT